jgi:hypothetical protein
MANARLVKPKALLMDGRKQILKLTQLYEIDKLMKEIGQMFCISD